MENPLTQEREEIRMKNIRNYGVATGRLTRDVTVFTNKDGSRKIKFTVAAQNHFTNGQGEYDSQALIFFGLFGKMPIPRYSESRK